MKVSRLERTLASVQKNLARQERSLAIKNGEIKGEDPLPSYSEDDHYEYMDWLRDEIDQLEIEIMIAG